MPYDLSYTEIERFNRDGFVGPFDAYTQQEMRVALAGLRRSLMDRRRAVYDLDIGGNIANYDRHLDIRFLFDHIHRPQILDRVRSILGPDILCWRTEFFVKYPGDEGTDWHQSRTMAVGSGVIPLEAMVPDPSYPDIGTTLTVWTALTAATFETSCMQYIPGSHFHVFYDDAKAMAWRPESVNSVTKNGVLRGLFGYDAREMQVDPSWEPDESRARNMELRAGQCVISWEATMHGSTPNVTKEQTRMAFVARYVPTSVRVYAGISMLAEYGGVADLARWRAVLVSGEDRFSHNRLLEHPPA